MCPSNLVGWNVHLNWEKPAHHLQAGRGEHPSGVHLESGLSGSLKKDWKDRSNKVNVLLVRNLHCFEQIFVDRQKAKICKLLGHRQGCWYNFSIEHSSKAAFNVVNRFKWFPKWLQSDTRKNSCPWGGEEETLRDQLQSFRASLPEREDERGAPELGFRVLRVSY